MIALSHAVDPYLNLALEAWLFEKGDLPLLFLWRNRPSVVVGRFQNPWRECDLTAMEQEAMCLVRRESGGGAVYHDLGNLNFSLISPKASYRRERATKLIVRALSSLGIEATITRRNDIMIAWQGRSHKVSGSAYRMGRERVLHHGTLLIDADLERASRTLCPAGRLFREWKGTPSMPSPIVNLNRVKRGLTYERCCDRIAEIFLNESENRAIHPFEEGIIRTVASERAAGLQSDPWLYGKTPAFVEDLLFCRSGKKTSLSVEVCHGTIRQIREREGEKEPATLSRWRGRSYAAFLRENRPFLLPLGVSDNP